MVLLYYELCEIVWGSLPATEQLKFGLEISDLDNSTTLAESSQSTSAISTTRENDQNSVQSNDNVTDGIDNLSDVSSDDHINKSTSLIRSTVSPSTVKMRRQFLGKKLGEYKQEKLKGSYQLMPKCSIVHPKYSD